MAKNLLYFDTTEEIKSVLNENEKLTTPPPTVALDKESGKVYYNPYAVKSREQIFFENYLTETFNEIAFYSINGVYYLYNNNDKKIYAFPLKEGSSDIIGKSPDNFEDKLFEKKYWRKATTEEMLKINGLTLDNNIIKDEDSGDITDIYDGTYHIRGIYLFGYDINLHINDKKQQEQHNDGIIDISVKDAGVLVSSNDDVYTYDLLYHEETYKSIRNIKISNFRLKKKENDPTIPYCYVYIYDPKD